MLETIFGGVIATAVAAVIRWAWQRWSGSEPTTLSLLTPLPAERPLPPESPPAQTPPHVQQQPPETAIWLRRTFIVYEEPWPQKWLDVPGLYVLAYRDPESNQGWAPLLLAVTGSFQAELPKPPRWPEAQRRGATHLHVHRAAPGKALRTFRERFVQEFQPPLNVEATQK